MSDKSKPILHKVRAIGQFNTKTCWVASYRMLYAWRGIADAECRRRISAGGFPTDEGLDISQWKKAAATLKLSGYDAQSLRGSFDKFVWVIKHCGPMWCAGDFLQRDPHAILVSGVYPDSKWIQIIDPWEVHRGSTTQKRHFDWWCDCIKQAPFACQLWW